MRRIITFTLLIALTAAACNKGEVKSEQSSMTVANAVKTGDWMVLYMERGVVSEIGLIFFIFSADGSLAVTKDGASYTGNWTESKTTGSHTLTVNITTADINLQKVSKSWNVVRVKEYYIDLADVNPASNVSVQLMKH